MYKSPGFILAVMQPHNGSYPERDGKVYIKEDAPFHVKIANNTPNDVYVFVRIAGKDYGRFNLGAYCSKKIRNLTARKVNNSGEKGIDLCTNNVEAVFVEKITYYPSLFRPVYYYPYYYDWSSLQVIPVISSGGCPSLTQSGTWEHDFCADVYAYMTKQGNNSVSATYSGYTPVQIEDKDVELPSRHNEWESASTWNTTKMVLRLMVDETLDDERFCFKCGRSIKLGENYCPKCGRKNR